MRTVPLPLRRVALPFAGTTRVLVVLGLLVALAAIGDLALHFTPAGASVPAFWPSSGIAVIALILTSPRWRPLTLLGVAVAAVLAHTAVHESLEVSMAFGVANVAEAALVTWVLTQNGRDRPRLEQLEDFFRLVAAALLGATLAGGLVGAAVAFFEGGQAWTAGRAVLSAHSAAILLLTPLAMQIPRLRRDAPLGEVVLQSLLLTVTVAAVFQPDQELPLAYLPYPILIWGAVRLAPREVVWQLIAYAAVVSTLTALGSGPFVKAVASANLRPELVGTLLHSSLLAAVVITLPLALIHTQSVLNLDDLTQSHDMVSNILGSTRGTAILGTTAEGRIEFFNVGAERLMGYSANQVVHHSVLQVSRDEHRRPTLSIGLGGQPDGRLSQVLDPLLDESGGSFTSDWQFLRGDGDSRTVSVAITRRLDSEGRPVGYLSVADDVTERRRHERTVEKALEAEKQLVDRLAQVDQAKNDFLATVSHELRTPITSIIGYSQLLVADSSSDLSAMHQQILGRIERNGRRLMGLIEDMLTMSQIEVGSLRFERVPLDVREPIQQAIDSVSSVLPVHQLELHQELPDTAVKVHGDGDKLERAFANLLSNAVKFSHPGDAVVIRLDESGGEARVSVIDKGVGISPEDQAHLFDRFYRGNNATARAIQGAGLGLSIANSIIAGHDGSIDIESVLGQGSRFTVRLPVLQD